MDRSLTRDAFRQHLNSIAAIYADAWPTIRDAHSERLDSVNFLEFQCPLTDPNEFAFDSDDEDFMPESDMESETILRGRLKFEPGKDNYKVVLQEFNDDTAWTTHISDEWFDAEKHRREQPLSISI